jgi:antitoxin Phd
MAEVLRFRNARGELVEVESIPATRLKNEPGAIIEKVITGGAVAITRHDTPRAVLLSYDDFRELAQAREPSLGVLSNQFDALLESMQAPGSRKAVASAFEASPDALGAAAVRAAAKDRPAARPRAVAARAVKRRKAGKAG